MTKTITHQPCPCGKSSDACTYFPETNSAHCHSCGETIHTVNNETKDMGTVSKSGNTEKFHPITQNYRAWPERGLTKETIETYKVTVSPDAKETGYEARYPRFNENGGHVGNKVRFGKTAKPPFIFEGDHKSMVLFGMDAFEPGSSRYLTITEGQDDAMAAHQMSGNKFAAISIDGVSSAIDDIKRNFEYINSFENIVLCFDGDEPGRRAAKAVMDQIPFPIGKVKNMTPRKFKDANDFLINKASKEFIQEWWNAPTHKPDGLKLGSQMWDEIIERKEHFTVAYPFRGLNELTYGLRLSELVIVTADTGVGKTTVLKTIEHAILMNEEVKKNNYGLGLLHLEEPNGDTALGLLSIHNRVPYHLPDAERPEDDLKKAYNEVLNHDRVVIWDHFGSNSVDAVVNKIRHMAALGCKYIVLDHLSIVVSDQSGDERKQLDEIATKVKTVCMELDIAVIAVIHTNRQGQIRGTAGVEQLANIVIRLQRDKTDNDEWRRNITKLSVEKNRFCGYTGPASYLYYNKETGTVEEISDEDAATFEQGGTINDIPF